MIIKERILLTPDMAKRLLDNNYPLNRALSIPVVLKYADDIKNNRWNEEVSNIDQPLATDQKGRLIQGQHRCHAVIEAGKAISTYIVRDVPESYYEFLDGGFARSAATYIQTKNANRVAAICGAICGIDDGHLSLKSSIVGKVGGSKQAIFQATRKAQIEKYREKKDLINWITVVSQPISSKTHLTMTSVAIALYVLFYTGEDRTSIEAFSSDYLDGPNEKANRILVDYCFNLMKANKKHSRPDDVAFILHAYDHYKTHSNLKSFNKYSSTFDRYEKIVMLKREQREDKDNA